jgi:ligand-binding sensor domain-containing protein/signal transduction histidine kinase
MGSSPKDARILNQETQKATARQYFFTHFNTGNGLSSNHVNNIIQDYRGYMWLATSNGLQRYDGNKFVTFRNESRNPKGLSHDYISLVYEDKKKNLWVVSFDNKVGIFNTSDFTYTEYPVHYRRKLPVFIPRSLSETSDGKLVLFAGYEGVYVLDEKKKEFREDRSLWPIPKGWNYQSVYQDTIRNKIWICCDSGLVVYNPATKRSSYRGHNVENDPTINEYSNILHTYMGYRDAKDRFFFATWAPGAKVPTLYFYDHKNNIKREHILSEMLGSGYYEILGMLQQRNGRFWLYGLSFLLEYEDDDKPLRIVRNDFNDNAGLKVNRLTHMYEDKQKNVWICSDNGVFFFNPDAQSFSAYSLIRPDGTGVIEGVTQTALEVNGQILIGGWGNGLYCYDTSLNPSNLPQSLLKFRDGYSYWSMTRSKATGMVWMTLQAGAIIAYDPAKNTAVLITAPEFDGRTIRCITEDQEGNMWFGTHRGRIVKWNRNAAGGDPRKGYEVIATTGLVHQIFTDKKGYVWIATLGLGLLKLDPSTSKIVDSFSNEGPETSRLWSSSPTDIAQMNDSILLVANGALDMINMRSGKVVHISTEDGLPGNNVHSIAIDKTGIIWLGTANGLCRFNIQIGTFTIFDRRDGIAYDAFGIGDAHYLSNGRLLFTNDHNFVVFDPARMSQSSTPPDALITDFKVRNESLSMDSLNNLSRIVLDHDNNSITIEFSALNFSKQLKLHYHYQLENLEGPREGTEQGQAIYNYIPPGEYTFTVYAETADGVSSKKITSLRILVRAPFYRSYWFYGFVLLAVLAFLYWLDRERVKKFRAMQQLRTQIAGNLHKEIDTTLNNISLLSEMAKIKADNDIARSKEYIDQINDKSRKMIVSMDDVFWSIDPANDSMEKTLLRMEEFVSAMKNRHGALIDMFVDEEVKSLKLDMISRHEIYVIFRRALRNISRSSNGAPILINIDFVSGRLSLKIHSIGNYGAPEILYEHEKLVDISKRAESIKAELDIQSDNKEVSVVLNVVVDS